LRDSNESVSVAVDARRRGRDYSREYERDSTTA
jgi:hypothetical protein